MDLLTVVVIYCFAVGGFFMGLWLFYGRREYSLFEQARRKTTFLCARCNKLYAAAGSPETCVCPRCGHENARLKF
ncbi:putative paraquat-inducible protein A [Ereboglobus sp. PH5-5]|uniref:Hydrogenase nickel incorporation protein HypA n=1 Tax=Ereboglobus luteus TaxID=1796921 RepID=A0A2U8E516_9BACT|nr:MULTISPECIES: hydrogenase nickel incorporation protein HypA [Ereboglobus]AWI09926.1 hydrogenase nickel incorporation protein HypA [Ereboglobus luteus]MDF9827782.1 putative paraquat-inducible protein A [Ereboglobus sp. PH5-10]MDF9834378.1 putative paraquat-inducible protein A [Ereboglobus sp. PH5-5]